MAVGGYPGDIQALIASSGPSSFQDGAGAGYPNAIASFADSSMKQAADDSAGPVVGKIVLGQGGYFDVQLLDGTYKRRVPNLYRTNWRIDDSVTLTRVNGTYSITGPGAIQGG